VEQTFDPVPVSTITEASYWEWHGEDVFTVAWWGYPDNTQDLSQVRPGPAGRNKMKAVVFDVKKESSTEYPYRPLR